MAIFNCYVSSPEGNWFRSVLVHWDLPFDQIPEKKSRQFVSSSSARVCAMDDMVTSFWNHSIQSIAHPTMASRFGFTYHCFTTRLGYDLNLGGISNHQQQATCQNYGCGSKIGHWSHHFLTYLSAFPFSSCEKMLLSIHMISCVTSASVKLRSRNLPNTGVVKCPMTWVYWTSPEKVAIIDHIPNGI